MSTDTESVDVDEAHDLVGDALESIRRVKDDYPALTAELEELLEAVDGHLVCVYLRLGREDESPSLTELGERYEEIGPSITEAAQDGGSDV